MITVGNERYLRSILMLHNCGHYIAKKIIQRELNKKVCTLDKLLEDERLKKKVKRECKHDMQQDILFPTSGRVDVDKMDIQMLTGIIPILFRSDLKANESKTLREIKRLRADLAHTSSASLSSTEYDGFVTDLDSYILTIASHFEESVQEQCRQLSQEYKSCPVLEILEKKHKTDPFQKLFCIVNARLSLVGDKTIVNLADKILNKVFNAAKTRTTNTDDMPELEQAVDEILKEFEKMEGVNVLSAEPECVLIKIQCDTYKSLYDVLTYTASKEYKEQLDSLANTLTSYYNAQNPLVIFSEISLECFRYVDKSTDEAMTELENRSSAGHLIKSETREELEDFVKHYDILCDSLSVKLEGMSEVLSKMTDENIHIESRVQRGFQVRDEEGMLKRSEVEDDNIKRDVSNNQSGPQARTGDVTESKLVVVAMDIGNTFIANAYSYCNDFERDKLELHIYQEMENSIGIKLTKTPAVALFDQENVFHSFGYEAEVKYAQLLDHAEENRMACQWRFFNDLSLNTHINKEYVLEDDKKQTMPALDVYAAILLRLKGQIYDYISSIVVGLNFRDLYWILPLPVPNSERHFFMQAVEKAGFPESRLAFLSKPKAAAIYCRELMRSNYAEDRKSKPGHTIIPGEKIIVVDAGCKTLNVTAHRVMSNGSIADLESFSHIDVSGDGSLVDVNIEDLVKEIFGTNVMERFRCEYKIDALELKHSFEMMKLQFKDPENEKMDFNYWLSVPSSLFEIFKELNGCKVSDIRQEDQNIFIPRKGNKVYISNDVVVNFFNVLKVNLIRQLRELFKEDHLRDVKTILFVGGLCDSEILRNELRRSFPMKKVIFPDKASTATVKGAVIYGHTIDAFF